ncbi:MAG: alcohol dehydrogenase catalytic domain-containing protein, partial [Clostridia bacterium]|nr:alcohol dehydrogenase catalytic domain-containing protein [Clostridia bacterium]
MKAVLWTGYGGAEVLVPGEVEIPDIKENEILVKVKASTVTMGDCEMRGLKLPLAFTLPIRLYFGFLKPRMGILGQEFSGIVEKTGKKVSKFKPGDKIFGQTGFSMGAYAQYLKVKENAMIIKKPDNLSFEEAAAIPLGSLESWYFLKRAEVKKGDH